MFSRSLLLLCAGTLLWSAACPGQGDGGALLADGGGPAQLSCRDGIITLTEGGREAFSIPMSDVIPYRIIQTSPYAVVTTCGADLLPSTYIAGAVIHRYPGMLPQRTGPRVDSLVSITTDQTAPGGRVVILAPSGELSWEHPSAQLLAASCGNNPTAPALAVPCTGTFIRPFGDSPELHAIDAPTGAITWQSALPALGPPDDVELIGFAGDHGLVALQYGYAVFQYLSVDIAAGTTEELLVLSGQPLTIIVQPGTMPEYRLCESSGSTVSLAVVDEQRGTGIIRFDLRAATAEFTRQDFEGPAIREDNPLPVGGGLASAADPPFPQSLLPVAHGPAWTIDALVEGSRFLVVGQDGAQWVEF